MLFVPPWRLVVLRSDRLGEPTSGRVPVFRDGRIMSRWFIIVISIDDPFVRFDYFVVVACG